MSLLDPGVRRFGAWGWRILRDYFFRPGSPWKLTFAITYRCNHRCRNCLIWGKGPKPSEELSTREILKFFSKSGRYLSWLDLTGGEIFMRPDIEEIGRGAVELCSSLYLLHFPTNGMFPEAAERLCRKLVLKRGPKLIVSVSLDGPPEHHSRLRGAPEAWDKALETFSRLKKIQGMEVYLGMTLSDSNAGLVEETLEAVRRVHPGLRNDDLHVNILHRSAHFFANTALPGPDPKAVGEAVRRVLEVKGFPTSAAHWLEVLYLKAVPRYLDTGRSPVPCSSLHNSCFIDSSGDVYPCTIWGRRLANIKEVGFDLGALWKEAATLSARATVKQDCCPGCWTPCEAYQSLLSHIPATLWKMGTVPVFLRQARRNLSQDLPQERPLPVE